MPPTPNQLRAQLRAKTLEAARGLDFDLAGIAAVERFPHLRHFAAWIAGGRHGEMDYLARRAAGEGAAPFLREDIRHAWPWARSVVCCGVSYHAGAPRPIDPPSGGDGGERGWISRYAWGDDYHETLRARLEALRDRMQSGLEGPAEFKITVDTAPLVEREAAARAGIGWQGKNTCLIHPRQGSFFFLGCIVTSLEMEADAPLPDRCGSCARCIDACPTGALDQPYQMDASRCLSYANIELRGGIPVELREPMGNLLVGCDICQDVCPWNTRAPITWRPEFQPRPGLVAPLLEELADMTVEGYRERFRHSAVKRVKYPALLRNVAVAMGNARNPRLRPALQRLAAHDDAMVREHARWALARCP